MNNVAAHSAVPAPLALRLLAGVYDLLPLLGLWFVVDMLALAMTGGTLDVRRLGDKVILQLAIFLTTAAYFGVSWLRGGQTIGMKPWRLRLVSANGRPISPRQAILRFCVLPLSLAAFGIGFWWALFDPLRRTWHDIAADTVLVKVQRE